MRILKVFVFMIFLFSSMELSGQTEHIKVMTYNIRMDNPGDGQDNWHHRKKDMVDYVKRSGPDFFAVQEALFHQLSYLDSALTQYDYIGVGRDDGMEAGEFMAIFYNKNRWNNLEENTIWLSETPGEVSRGWDAACNRVCSYGTFIDDSGLKLKLFNTHLDHQGKVARKESISLLKKLIEEEKKDFPVVLTGDFNLKPDDPLYLDLTAFLMDSQGVADETMKVNGTWNGFHLEGDFPSRIDYIFTNELILVEEYRVDEPKTIERRQLSDHFPVGVKLQVMHPFLYKTFEKGKEKLLYRQVQPAKMEKGKKYPVLLFLHGSGERGQDNEMQLFHGKEFFLRAMLEHDAIVILPQCPREDYWSMIKHNRQQKGEEVDERPGIALGLLMDLLDKLILDPQVDADRIYAMGLSMGGMGVFELAWRIPDQLAAVVPICGKGDVEKAGSMKDIPFWIFHGTEDAVVPARGSVQMLEAIQQAGGKAKISLYHGVKHNSWDNAFAEKELLPWIFSKKKH